MKGNVSSSQSKIKKSNPLKANIFTTILMGHLLEEKEEHEVGDSCPENISESLPKHPLHLGPDHGHEEDHVDDGDDHGQEGPC